MLFFYMNDIENIKNDVEKIKQEVFEEDKKLIIQNVRDKIRAEIKKGLE